MLFSANDLVTLYRPSKCSARVHHNSHDVQASKPSPWDEVLRDLGLRHEALHLDTFTEVLDLRSGKFEDRLEATRQAVRVRKPVIYQGVLCAPFPGAAEDAVTGIPDFLIACNDSYVIRDCKLARHADEDVHPEILRQLDLYGWLFRTTFGMSPVALEVLRGDGNLVRLPVTDGHQAINDLQAVRSIVLQHESQYEPVGWSKCAGCPYNAHCWAAAESAHDIAMLPDIDQSAARTLHSQGTVSISNLLSNHTETTLASIQRPWGKGMQRIGKKSTAILHQAKAVTDKVVLKVAPLNLDLGRNVVMFDLEGMPPYFDEMEKVYLWGLQVFGEKRSAYVAGLADFGEDGDQNGWQSFLRLSQELFDTYGDMKFVHWAAYEPTKLRLYINRFGDPNGVGQRVLNSCYDLLPAVKNSLIFPLPSYSLKVIEKYIGFERTMEDFGGEWSMAQYVRAVETEDVTLRNRLMADIQLYNREDLEAMWAVLQWLHQWQ